MRRVQLGDFLNLRVWARDSSMTPTLPARAPVADIFTDSGSKVLSVKLPIEDRYGVTAFFQHRLFLDDKFSPGRHRVIYSYIVSTNKLDEDAFEVVAGGNGLGAGISMHHLFHPTSEFLLLQTNSGRLLRLRNPRV
jgi:hypothetical protein